MPVRTGSAVSSRPLVTISCARGNRAASAGISRRQAAGSQSVSTRSISTMASRSVARADAGGGSVRQECCARGGAVRWRSLLHTPPMGHPRAAGLLRFPDLARRLRRRAICARQAAAETAPAAAVSVSAACRLAASGITTPAGERWSTRSGSPATHRRGQRSFTFSTADTVP